jgi:hypothetical protein
MVSPSIYLRFPYKFLSCIERESMFTGESDSPMIERRRDLVGATTVAG